MRSKAERTSGHEDDLGIYGLPGDVSPWDIRFDPHDRAFLEPLGGGRFAIRVWTEPGFGEGRVVVRSPGDVASFPMEAMETARFTYWAVEIGPYQGPVDFSFAFKSPARRPVYRVKGGVSSAVERLDRWVLDPAMEPIEVPAWARGAVIYQVFPDRFHNGDTSNDPPGTEPWGSQPHRTQFQGGDLEGVISGLDYLHDLGVDCIYLNPIFTSPSNHRYDTVDYYQVDPALGDNQTLDRLVEAAHRLGMRVILDASLNHVHPRFFAFADLLEHGASSPYLDWFVVNDWPLRIRHRADRTPNGRLEWLQQSALEAGVPVEAVFDQGRWMETTYESWYHVPTMPRVNLANPDARDYMLQVARHWIVDHDIDGWRMDVARYVDPDFWDDLRYVIKSARPDAYLLAEVMGDASAWLQGNRFDATMNYTFRSLTLGFFARDELDGTAFLDGVARLLHQHPWEVALVNHNLIGSHDTARFLTEARGDIDRLRLATVFQMTFPGAPGIYYGDEVGMQGGPDPHNRGAFPWEAVDGQHPVQETVRKLTALRRRFEVLRTGAWKPLTAREDAVAYQRQGGAGRIGVIINRGVHPVTIDAGQTVIEVIWGTGDPRDSEITVPGGEAVLYR